MKKQRGYTVVELLFALWTLIIVAAGISIIGVVIWAIVKLVSHYT